MTKKVIIGSILGAIVLFIWTSVSWMYFPYHKQSILKFTDEAAVAKVIQDNSPTSGIYVVPNTTAAVTIQSIETKPAVAVKETPAKPAAPAPKAATPAAAAPTTAPAVKAVEQVQPFVFTSVYKPGTTSMTRNLFLEFAGSLLGALLFGVLLLFVKHHKFFCRLGFVVVYAMSLAVISDVSFWNWWHFSDAFTYLAMGDKLIGWTLAGTLMTLIIRCDSTCTQPHP